MPFSRALASAAFTALKWLFVLTAVLFAALAVRVHFDGDGARMIGGSLAAGSGALAAALLMHKLARAIGG